MKLAEDKMLNWNLKGYTKKTDNTMSYSEWNLKIYKAKTFEKRNRFLNIKLSVSETIITYNLGKREDSPTKWNLCDTQPINSYFET